MSTCADLLRQAIIFALENLSTNHTLPLHPFTIAVACSGGRDSMLLADLCVELFEQQRLKLPHTLILLTVDHGLHTESTQFAKNIVKYWRSRKIQCKILNADPQIIENGAGLEDGARRARYSAIEDARIYDQIDFVFFAHHAGDQAETMLMRLQAPSGLKGLNGIPAQRDWIVRPWLHIHPTQIKNEHTKRDLPIFEDPSNQDLRFLRNRIRHIVAPACQTVFDDNWIQRTATTAAHLREDTEILDYFFDQFIKPLIKDLRSIGRIELSFDIDQKALPTALEKKILRHVYSMAITHFSTQLDLRRIKDQIPILLELWTSRVDRQRSLPHQLNVWGSKGRLIIYATQFFPLLPLQKTIDHHQLYTGMTVTWGEWILKIQPYSRSDKDQQQLGTCFCAITGPLTMKRPIQGARFTPHAAPGSKRITRLWSDRKIPVFERSRLPVLTDNERRVVWIPFCRPSSLIIPSKSCSNCQLVSLDWQLNPKLL